MAPVSTATITPLSSRTKKLLSSECLKGFQRFCSGADIGRPAESALYRLNNELQIIQSELPWAIVHTRSVTCRKSHALRRLGERKNPEVRAIVDPQGAARRSTRARRRVRSHPKNVSHAVESIGNAATRRGTRAYGACARAGGGRIRQDRRDAAAPNRYVCDVRISRFRDAPDHSAGVVGLIAGEASKVCVAGRERQHLRNSLRPNYRKSHRCSRASGLAQDLATIIHAAVQVEEYVAGGRPAALYGVGRLSRGSGSRQRQN
jgi:hypothetical protein